MNALLGHAGLLLALIGALGGIGDGLRGLLRGRDALLVRATRWPLVALAGALVASAAMERALVTHDFSLAFVAANNARTTPLFFSITGMWSALQGSILLWVLILAGYLALVARHFRARATDRVVAVALVTGLAVATFFLALMLGPADPFAAQVGAVANSGAGAGANALLQNNLLVAIHPPLLYLGYVGFTIPYAFAIGSLVTGRVGEGWLVEVRRFALVAFAFLTVGIMLGGWWSYQVLGWGGFWGWDPVENAALLPWLTATAYLHSVMVQERRGLLRIWNLSLLIATFSLTILGTFLTRSGAVNSVHAFSDSGIGPALLSFFAVVVVSGVVLIGWRGDRLASPGGIDSPLSREGAFLVNNFLFAAFAVVVLVGTVFPLFVQTFSNQQVSIGRPYFDTFTVPIGIALLFFMAIAPVLPWRVAAPGLLARRLLVSAWAAAGTIAICVLCGLRGLLPLGAFGLGAFAAASALRQLVLAALASRRHGLSPLRGLVGRANGGMIVHLGIIVIAVGLSASSSFQVSRYETLTVGRPVTIDHHRFLLEGVRSFSSPDRSGVQAVVSVDGRYTLRPAVDTFAGQTEHIGTPSIRSTLIDDVYLSPGSEITAGARRATLTILVIPLVIWMWIGGFLAGAGALLAAWPGRRRRPTDPISVAIPELLPPVPAGVGS
ncbi:MAG TPA: cytochrome c-type biogenesis CcmF C-terminal domain-containing protein [Acidimicrobiales bacterium]|nr:cytochrome c-type biogenesis CcmF C-terminal domain-containing protein [Acidimicrobiales bacterium]